MPVKRNLPSSLKNPNKDKDDNTDHSPKSPPFSKLLDGVVFALSGFVNPERGSLRSQAMEMGAEFRPDWGPGCTLLVCAFFNTPKFNQVEADNGTIVSKEWITQCYDQKKLVEIDPYIMHPGKPWRKQNNSMRTKQENVSQSIQKDAERKPASSASLPSTSKGTSAAEDLFPSSEVRKWAISDLRNTISWLESQEEKPQPGEMKKIATEGVITCLQDAIEALQQNKDIQLVMDQWMFVPRIVEELSKLEGGESRSKLPTKKELIKLALSCKQIYTDEISNLEITPMSKKAKRTAGIVTEARDKNISSDSGSDSDATIVMTEEEIEQAWRGS